MSQTLTHFKMETVQKGVYPSEKKKEDRFEWSSIDFHGVGVVQLQIGKISYRFPLPLNC